MNLVIVGQAPGRAPGRPLGPEGRSGRRLLELAGLTYEELTARAKVTNLGCRYPGRNGNGHGDRFPGPPYWHVFDGLEPGSRTICVGRAVAIALLGPWTRDAPFCRWLGGGVAILPHPSGLNHWWNDQDNVRVARRFLRRALAM